MKAVLRFDGKWFSVRKFIRSTWSIYCESFKLVFGKIIFYIYIKASFFFYFIKKIKNNKLKNKNKKIVRTIWKDNFGKPLKRSRFVIKQIERNFRINILKRYAKLDSTTRHNTWWKRSNKPWPEKNKKRFSNLLYSFLIFQRESLLELITIAIN